MTSAYHITGETPAYFFEAQVEQDYKFDPAAEDPDDAYYPVGAPRFFEIVVTDKKTGLSTDEDEMPGGIINTAKEEAENQFPL